MQQIALLDPEFDAFRALLYDKAGILLAPTKKHLVSGRLGQRLRAHGLSSFDAYYRLLTGGRQPDEMQRMLDLLTTHETYFFREPRHFSYFADVVLPALAPGAPLRVWSAASSSGEEAWSLAMVLMDRLGKSATWEILASDISRSVLAQAKSGIYPTARLDGLPREYLARYCLRGVDSKAGTIRIAPPLRSHVHFAQINLNAPLTAVGEFEVIFLRNVLIYFDAATKRAVVDRLLQQLRPGGWLFVGHSETLSDFNSQLRLECPAVYRKL